MGMFKQLKVLVLISLAMNPSPYENFTLQHTQYLACTTVKNSDFVVVSFLNSILLFIILLLIIAILRRKQGKFLTSVRRLTSSSNLGDIKMNQVVEENIDDINSKSNN